MEHIDIFTVLALTAMNLIAVSVALPWVMGRSVSRAARLAQGSLLAQAFGWIAIICAGSFIGHWGDRALSTLSLALGAAAQILMFRALGEWLGPRPGWRAMQVIAVLMPLGYAIGFGHYSFRVGWANFLLATMMLLVAQAAFAPRRPAMRHWRWLLGGCHAVVAVFTLGRGGLGAFLPELYPSFRAPHPVNLGAQLATNIGLVLTTVAVLVAWRDEAEARLRELAVTDGLTGVLNHRAWHERAATALATAHRHQQPLTVLLIDLDQFKAINDNHGHDLGDRALRLFGQVLRENVRDGDLAGRLGGEEFVVLLCLGPLAAAELLDRRLRDQLSRTAEAALGIPLDFSAGATDRQAGDATIQAMVARADRAMYRAKQAGRGRLELDLAAERSRPT